MYEVELQRAAADVYRKAPTALQKKLDRCFEQLSIEPHSHPNIKPLVGSEAGKWRYRVGDWRVVYEIHEQQVIVSVINILHRGEAYRRKR